MPIDENGFLGKDASTLATQIRERNKSLFEFCLEVNRFAQKLKYDLVVHNLDPQEFLSTAFFLRVLASAQAAIVLVERGLELEAATIIRSVFEALVYLKCCIEDDQFAYEYMIYGLVKKRDDLNNILLYKMYERSEQFESEESVRKMISEIEEQIRKNGVIKIGNFKKCFSKYELAKRAKMEEYYASFYSVTSDAAHTGMGALSKYLKTDKHELSDKEARMHLIAIAEFVLSASAYICELFKIEKKAEIEAIHEKIKKL